VRSRAYLEIDAPIGVLKQGLVDAFRDLWEGTGGAAVVGPLDRPPAAPAGALPVVDETPREDDDVLPFPSGDGSNA
jgi:hypothetical protein